jgi:PIN domain nuclease of toxin-antitoxin system
MKLLLDTHIFIWWASEPEMQSEAALRACQDESAILLLSVASVWEMQIKVQLGKLKLKAGLQSLVDSQQVTNNLQVLAVELSHVLGLDALPAYHKDPFDRLLIAQSIAEDAILVSADQVFTAYPVKMIS